MYIYVYMYVYMYIYIYIVFPVTIFDLVYTNIESIYVDGFSENGGYQSHHGFQY